jgi:hypothetical protein
VFGRKGVQSNEGRNVPTAESFFDRELTRIISEAAGLHPLDVAARLTALFGTRDFNAIRTNFIRVRDIDNPTVCDLSRMEGDPVGLSFSFYGTAGETGLIYLTTAFAQLAPQGADPSPRVPAEMISRFVENYDDAVRKVVAQRTPQRSPTDLEQARRLKSALTDFLG